MESEISTIELNEQKNDTIETCPKTKKVRSPKQIQYMKEYYEENKEELIYIQKQRYKEKRDELNQKSKERYQQKRSEILEKVTCDHCNKQVTRSAFYNHRKSKQCLNFGIQRPEEPAPISKRKTKQCLNLENQELEEPTPISKDDKEQ